MYHLRDGLFFARSNATDVCIIKTTDGKTPWRQSREAGQPFDTNIVFELTVPENEWASVVASVSVLGENSQRWNAVRDFHTNPEDSTQAMADASHAIIVLRGMLERGAAYEPAKRREVEAMKIWRDSSAQALAEAFLRWPLPDTVCADLCATKQGEGRIGTNLLSFIEAKQMMTDIVLPALAPLAVMCADATEQANKELRNEVTRLTAERREVECLRKQVAGNAAMAGRLENERDDLRAALAKTQEELKQTKMAVDHIDAAAKNIEAALRAQLAQAQRERDEACKVITDLRLGPPGGKPISDELKASLNEMSEQAYERASLKGNLERSAATQELEGLRAALVEKTIEADTMRQHHANAEALLTARTKETPRHD